ncbi:MAG TPA: tRNA (adenosine(37)-N6)-threonylcarbamoyltransferase complex dimerization subunit type 1 TsaB [Ignavibacteria bacterium]|nr:tRNA (adenosine(37)-N6)-threonylcarbamoyltransferase complex dimerization subunit type 1 TsaB [Ignavibacteria bacterium]
MGILLIDSSSAKIEFGYADKDIILFKKELEPGYNADALTFFIRDSFISNQVDIKNIKYIGLSNGPGSFTGLRIGSAISKGLCFTLGSKLIEVSTLDVIANKFIQENSPVSVQDEKKITSLIFSNTRLQEFYFCEYEITGEKLNRISAYRTDLLENIIIGNSQYVINEKINNIINSELQDKITDVSALSNIDPLFGLVLESIRQNKFSDYKTSEPFYMKVFVPNN